jgi:hypothetical protein
MERRWTAAVAVNASQCAAKAGNFQLAISRGKENARPLEFREQFTWMAPLSLAGIDVAADEAIEYARIDSVEPCVCADSDSRR